MEDLAKAWKAFKGWFSSIFKMLLFLDKGERLLKESKPSVKANAYFSRFILVAILIWFIILLIVNAVTHDPSITGMFIVQTIGIGFLILGAVIIACNFYHNKRPASD